MKTPVHLGKITKGKFIPNNREWWLWEIEALEGYEVLITIEQKKHTRSLELNAFYHGFIVRPLTQFFNQEKTFNRMVSQEYVHEILKAKFLGLEKVMIPGGEIIEKVNSSRKLDNQEFKDYCDNCIAWCNELFNLNLDWPPEKEQAA